jgi:hypothetical protein
MESPKRIKKIPARIAMTWEIPGVNLGKAQNGLIFSDSSTAKRLKIITISPNKDNNTPRTTWSHREV